MLVQIKIRLKDLFAILFQMIHINPFGTISG